MNEVRWQILLTPFFLSSSLNATVKKSYSNLSTFAKVIVNKKYWIVTNLITHRALFSPTYLLNLVKPELAPFNPPTPKTLP